MRANISQVNLYQTCPQKWYNRYVLKRIPVAPAASALRIGTAWHTAMQETYTHYKKHGNWTDAVVDGGLESLDQILIDPLWSDKDRKTLEHLRESLDYMKPPDFKPSAIIDIEKPLVADLKGSNHILCVRPDMIIKQQSRLWHVQHKAMTPARVSENYIESQRLSPHELGYWYVMEQVYDRKVGGTEMHIVKKGPYKGTQQYVKGIVPFNSTLRDEFLRDLIVTLDEMELIIQTGALPVKNRNACAGPYGNSLCEYWDVCSQRTVITDNTRYKDQPEEYFEAPQEAE